MIYMGDDDYSGFHERVSEKVDPKKGIHNELERIFRGSETQPRQGQEELVADYYTEDKNYDRVKTSFNNKEYVKRGDNTYERVEDDKTGGEVVFNPRTGRYYYRDDKGFKSIVKR